MHPRYGRRLPLNPQQSLLLSLGSWGVATVTVLLATLLHALNDPRAIPFFISETDQLGAADLVFTVGLTLAGLVQMAYAYLEHCKNLGSDTLLYPQVLGMHVFHLTQTSARSNANGSSRVTVEVTLQRNPKFLRKR